MRQRCNFIKSYAINIIMNLLLSILPYPLFLNPFLLPSWAFLLWLWWFYKKYIAVTKGKKLGVIGMKGAGKTTFLAHLGLVKDDGGTSLTSYEKKTIFIGNRELEIAAGEDIGGEDEFVKDYYGPWLTGNDKKDIIVFIFNGYSYLNDKEYRKNTMSRLDYVHRNYKKEVNDVEKYDNIVLIASHLDEYGSKDIEKMRKEIITSVAGKEYHVLFKKNFFPIDLRDRKIVDKINSKIFA